MVSLGHIAQQVYLNPYGQRDLVPNMVEHTATPPSTIDRHGEEYSENGQGLHGLCDSTQLTASPQEKANVPQLNVFQLRTTSSHRALAEQGRPSLSSLGSSPALYDFDISGIDIDMTMPRPNASGGILPMDSFQDYLIRSVEMPDIDGQETGVIDYKTFTHDKKYDSIGVNFEDYRRAPPRNEAQVDQAQHEIPPPDNLDLGPRENTFDYSRLPDHDEKYKGSIYTGTTSNPLISLAIIRIAEKNMPNISFDSALEHLPNVGPTKAAPLFPPKNKVTGKMPFLDKKPWVTQPSDQRIEILFLPNYFVDGRHAVGYYTRKEPSGQFCDILFAPCTTKEMLAAGLMEVPKHIDLFGSAEFDWIQITVGLYTGTWYHSGPEEIQDEWSALQDIVRLEWRVRYMLTTQDMTEQFAEPLRDDGRWGYNETE